MHLQTYNLKTAILLKSKKIYQILFFVVVFEGFGGEGTLCLGFFVVVLGSPG